MLLLLLAGSYQPGPATIGVDRVTYVYEKDEGAVPPPIQYALGELNKLKIVATAFEIDSTTGLDSVPAQDRIAVEAAKKPEAGLPCLVVQAGDKVTTIIKSPTTVKQIADAVGVEIKEPS